MDDDEEDDDEMVINDEPDDNNNNDRNRKRSSNASSTGSSSFGGVPSHDKRPSQEDTSFMHSNSRSRFVGKKKNAIRSEPPSLAVNTNKSAEVQPQSGGNPDQPPKKDD